MKLLKTLALLLSFSAFGSNKTSNTISGDFVLEGTLIANMAHYSEGARLALGMDKKDVIVFDKEDTYGLVISCPDSMEIFASEKLNEKNKVISFSSKTQCLALRETIIKAENSVDDNNPIKLIFSEDKTEFRGFILPKK